MNAKDARDTKAMLCSHEHYITRLKDGDRRPEIRDQISTWMAVDLWLKVRHEIGDWRSEIGDWRPGEEVALVKLHQVGQLFIPPIRFTMARMICRSDSLNFSIFLLSSANVCWLFADAGNMPAWRMISSGDTPKARAS